LREYANSLADHPPSAGVLRHRAGDDNTAIIAHSTPPTASNRDG
jgi:hypothetical protein